MDGGVESKTKLPHWATLPVRKYGGLSYFICIFRLQAEIIAGISTVLPTTLKLESIHFNCQKSDIILPKGSNPRQCLCCCSKGKEMQKNSISGRKKTPQSLYTLRLWVVLSQYCNSEHFIDIQIYIQFTDFIIVVRHFEHITRPNFPASISLPLCTMYAWKIG